MSKIYGYCRTARAGNIEKQIELISKYCKNAELKLEMCFCDDGISAHKMDRPEMSKLFKERQAICKETLVAEYMEPLTLTYFFLCREAR